VKQGHKEGPISNRSATDPASLPRVVAIRNAHQRLHVPRVAVTRAITLLDAHFEMLPNDLPHLSLRRPQLAVLRSKIDNQNSKIRGACPAGELSLVFLTDMALAKIHGDFMDDPTATDVITFEGDATSGLAGEICVSADTAWKYVGSALAPTSRASSPQAATLRKHFAAELTLYVVHGWLHLAGYDDLQPAKKRRMRAAEARAMKLLADHRAIPPFRLK
jgi:probable rRNA maturation factor